MKTSLKKTLKGKDSISERLMIIASITIVILCIIASVILLCLSLTDYFSNEIVNNAIMLSSLIIIISFTFGFMVAVALVYGILFLAMLFMDLIWSCIYDAITTCWDFIKDLFKKNKAPTWYKQS